MAKRITNNVERGERLTLKINGKVVSAHSGETVATVLFAEGIHVFYKTRHDQPRGPFCNMGTCFECLVKVRQIKSSADETWIRACMTPVEEGMVITTGGQTGPGESAHDKD